MINGCNMILIRVYKLRNHDKSVLLDKGVYSKGEHEKLYHILFDCKCCDLNASNQAQINDINDDVKWKKNMFCKYFYQQNVQNKWVRIVRRKMTLVEESKNCLIM